MSPRRGGTDALDTSREPRGWVVRDRLSRPIEHGELGAGADLRAATAAKHAELAAAGWRVDSIPKNCGFFFADRDNDRVYLAIECFEPVSNSSLERGP